MKPFKKITLKYLVVLTAIGISSASWAGDEKVNDATTHGQRELNKHCYKCHTDQVYTRKDRFVKSIEALNKQVVRCKDGNDIPWFDEDTNAVVQFLNSKYYKF